MAQILIVEDEKAIADTLTFALASEHFQPTWVQCGEAAINACQAQSFDCVLLDIGLPDINGFEVLKAIHQCTDVPVIFLTARNDEIDRILGLEMGADDYISKPFSPREVVTRVKVILRRQAKTTLLTHHSDFYVDDEQAVVSLNNQALSLTRAEYLLLKAMLAQPKRVFSRGQLITAVWDENHPSDERVIDTHIKTLRAKLRDIDPLKTYIQTHRGLGYSITP